MPANYAGVVTPLLLSISMTFIVSLVATFNGIGPAAGFLHIRVRAWAVSWLIAGPALLLVLPALRRATMAFVRAA